MNQVNKFLTVVKLFALGVSCLLFTNSVQAYNPPIGIPDPGNTWGGGLHPIDTPAPDVNTKCPLWPSEASTECYYIDNTNSNATDTDNPYGYPDKPRMTVPEDTYSAGSYIEIHGGPYNDTYLNISCLGTESNPCWLRGTSADMPIFPKAVIIKDSSYLIAEYLDFNGGDSSGGLNIAGNSHHITIRNSQFRNKTYVSNSAGIGIKPDLGDSLHDVVIYGCNFEDLGDWTVSDSDPDYHGIVPSLWGRDSTTEEYNVWILNNTFYHLSGDGVQVNSGNWEESYKYLHHIYIGRNTAHALRQSGFWSKQASDVIISENTAYDFERHGGSGDTCFGFQYRPNNIWIMYNTCYDAGFGVRVSDSTGYGDDNKAYIIGNTFYDIKPDDLSAYDPDDPWRGGVAISLWTGDMYRYVVDNTIHDCYNGINAIQSGDGSGLEMSGNIISDIDSESWHIFMFQNMVDEANIDYTLMYDSDHNARVRWGSYEYTSLNAFTTVNPEECVHCLQEANPLFQDAQNNNFEIQDISPAKDSGMKSDVYDIFFNLYGLSITVDKNGISRPQGNGWDIGAYEYVENQTIRADVDNNSTINTTDAMLTLRNSLGLNMSNTNWFSSATTGDVNCDGTSNSTDAMLILRHSLGLDMTGTGWCE
jgi:hypothetical protein